MWNISVQHGAMNIIIFKNVFVKYIINEMLLYLVLFCGLYFSCWLILLSPAEIFPMLFPKGLAAL